MIRTRSGMTLVEVLISVSLLSVLAVSVLLTLRVGVNALERTNTILIANRRAVSAERILLSQIAGFIPASADCVVGPDRPPVRVPFFEGRPQSMRFVSSYSLEEASRGLPRILEYQVVPGEENRGVRLIVNELLYTGPRATGAACLGLEPVPELGVQAPRFRPIEPGPRSFVLADKLAFCRFSFRQPRPLPELERWLPEWRLPRWPTAVRIELEQLDPEPTRAPLVSVTAPVRVNRPANETYTDD